MDSRADEQTVERDALSVADLRVTDLPVTSVEQVWASRAVIERATGVLMERYGLDADRAKQALLQASRRTGVPMLGLAEEVLTAARVDEPRAIRQVLEGECASPALRKAVDFIESEAGNPIKLADIVVAAGVGARALQYDFVRHYHTTPMRYLRSVRLERAHQELRTADPQQGDTVASIAARWGYSSPGRFAEQYRAVYGRTPNRTLAEDPMIGRGPANRRESSTPPRRWPPYE